MTENLNQTNGHKLKQLPVSMSIPPEIMERVRAHPELNFSRICREALSAAAECAETGHRVTLIFEARAITQLVVEVTTHNEVKA